MNRNDERSARLRVVGVNVIISLLLPMVCSCAPDHPLAYKVAVVTPNYEDDQQPVVARIPPGPLILRGVTLRELIIRASSEPLTQVSGGPEWVTSDRWNFHFEVDGPILPAQQYGRVLMKALEDRFALLLHRERRIVPVNELTVASTGSKLQPDPWFVAADPDKRVEHGLIRSRNVSVATLAKMLSLQLEQPVIDRTGLQGMFRIALRWSSSSGQPDGHRKPSPSTGAPSLSDALEAQLGLRLTAGHDRVDVIVIDKAQKPSVR